MLDGGGGGGMTAGDVLVAGGFTGAGAVEEIGASPAGDPPPPALRSGAAPYTGAFSSHGAEHTAVTRAQWVKRMHKMPKGN